VKTDGQMVEIQTISAIEPTLDQRKSQ